MTSKYLPAASAVPVSSTSWTNQLEICKLVLRTDPDSAEDMIMNVPFRASNNLGADKPVYIIKNVNALWLLVRSMNVFLV